MYHSNLRRFIHSVSLWLYVDFVLLKIILGFIDREGKKVEICSEEDVSEIEFFLHRPVFKDYTFTLKLEDSIDNLLLPALVKITKKHRNIVGLCHTFNYNEKKKRTPHSLISEDDWDDLGHIVYCRGIFKCRYYAGRNIVIQKTVKDICVLVLWADEFRFLGKDMRKIIAYEIYKTRYDTKHWKQIPFEKPKRRKPKKKEKLAGLDERSSQSRVWDVMLFCVCVGICLFFLNFKSL